MGLAGKAVAGLVWQTAGHGVLSVSNRESTNTYNSRLSNDTKTEVVKSEVARSAEA